uniref:Neurotrypsin n=1 Tax=Oryzias latipes TaxID=8090 RepID=A0A3P9H0A6_ORYLA
MRVALLASIAVVLAASDCYSSRVSSSVILPFTDCVRSRGKDGFYRGSIDVTESGSRCMNWTEVAGFQERHPGKGIGEHNHCRNPDSRIRPWCFFRNHKGRIDWGYCDCKQAVVTLPMRLIGGESESEGTVEVFHAGQWGSICDDQWDDSDAEVVCRQLGLSGAAKAWGQAHFGKSSGRVWLDEVRCTGNELSLEQCTKSAWGEHNCLHSEDAGVSCHPLTDGATRLVGGAGSHEGRLEIFYQGQWGTVCDDGWTKSNSQVVCRQLDIPPGPRFGVGSGPILLDDVNCTGKEPSLLLCSRREWLCHDCSHQEDVHIACNPEINGESLPASLRVRLAGGESSREGRVELYLFGQWGTVCDDGWTDQDAEVVCRQLGYSGAAKARLMAYFGEGTGPIHMDNVNCIGDERSIADCIKQMPGTHNCRHSEDAGVICDYGEPQHSTKEAKDPAISLCGLRLVHTRQRRIIGGENSLRGGWPWQAAIRLRGSKGDGRLVCGATLIDTCWVLTSAHCFKRYGNSTKLYKVRVGDYHSLVPEEYEEEYGVDKIVFHPRYHSHSNDYDLALVHLSPGAVRQTAGECVSFSRHVLPVCLPARKERLLKQASNCHITGWGDTGRSYSKTLQQAPLSLLPRRHCQQYFHSAFTSRMLCAGSVQSDRRVDSCRGDSGGPLVCERPGGGWVIYGVTSWGHACRTQQSPGVYTKVSAFSFWIRKIIRRDEKTR